MSVVKQAHTVPRFYLERFVDQNGLVWNYDKSSGTRWQAKPCNTATQGNFYAIPKEDGTLDLTIESYLADIEEKAQSGYETLLMGGIPQGQARADFAGYIATQFVRTSAMRKMYAEIQAHRLQERVNAIASDKVAFDRFMLEKGETLSDEKREELRLGILEPSNFILSVPQELTVSALLQADDLMEIVYKMNWSVGRASDSFFITADNPVAAYANGGLIRSNAKPAEIYSDKESLFDLPLSPDLILVISWKNLRERITVKRRRVLIANRERAIRADRFVYSHLNEDCIGRLAIKYKDARWGIREKVDLQSKSKVHIERLSKKETK